VSALVGDKMIDEVTSMSPTFETVLKQAKVLSAAENGRDDEAVIAALREKVDEMERTENPKANSSAKIGERIRKWNDRGYTL
jgi:hypothetical protein